MPVLPAIDRADGQVESKLKALGVEALGIVATPLDNARLYFEFRPTRLRLASDPEMSTHRAYRLPKPAPTPEFLKDMDSARINPFGDFPAPLPVGDAAMTTAKQDGRGERDRQGRHGPPVAPAQGPVPDRPRRQSGPTWSASHRSAAGVGKFPTGEEILAAARALPR